MEQKPMTHEEAETFVKMIVDSCADKDPQELYERYEPLFKIIGTNEKLKQYLQLQGGGAQKGGSMLGVYPGADPESIKLIVQFMFTVGVIQLAANTPSAIYNFFNPPPSASQNGTASASPSNTFGGARKYRKSRRTRKHKKNRK